MCALEQACAEVGVCQQVVGPADVCVHTTSQGVVFHVFLPCNGVDVMQEHFNWDFVVFPDSFL